MKVTKYGMELKPVGSHATDPCSAQSEEPSGSGGFTILGVDPGETCGFATLDVAPKSLHIYRAEVWEVKGTPIEGFVGILVTTRPAVVVIEDYVIYGSVAKMHIGQQLITAKLIGAMLALCDLYRPSAKVTVIPAAKKGRWPDARIAAKLPRLLHDLSGQLTSEHVKDALKLALVGWEELVDAES